VCEVGDGVFLLVVEWLFGWGCEDDGLYEFVVVGGVIGVLDVEYVFVDVDDFGVGLFGLVYWGFVDFGCCGCCFLGDDGCCFGLVGGFFVGFVRFVYVVFFVGLFCFVVHCSSLCMCLVGVVCRVVVLVVCAVCLWLMLSGMFWICSCSVMIVLSSICGCGG